MIDFDDKDLGIIALLLIAIFWIIFSAGAGTVVHDIVLAIASVITGSKLAEGGKK